MYDAPDVGGQTEPIAPAAASSRVILLKSSSPPHTRFISTTVVLAGEVSCTMRSLTKGVGASSPVRLELVMGPEPAMVTVEVTVHTSQMVTGTLVLVNVFTGKPCVLVAVGRVLVGVGVMVGELLGVSVGVEVGHVPALSVNRS